MNILTTIKKAAKSNNKDNKSWKKNNSSIKKDPTKLIFFALLIIYIGLCAHSIHVLFLSSIKTDDYLLSITETAISGVLTLGSLYFAIHFQEKNHFEQLKQQRELFTEQINESKLPYFIMQQKDNPTAIKDESSSHLPIETESILAAHCNTKPNRYRVFCFVVYNTSSAWAINVKLVGNTTITHCKPNNSFEVELCLSSISPPKQIVINYNDCRGIFYEQEFMIIAPYSPGKPLQLISQIPTKKEFKNED